MKLQQLSDHCYAVLAEKAHLFCVNSGLVNRGGGLVIDTQSDLSHARRMMELFGKVWPHTARQVVNTHEDADHLWGNQLFEDAQIIGHRTLAEEMPKVANPAEIRWWLWAVRSVLSRALLRSLHPGLVAAGEQVLQEFDFAGVRLVPPTTLFDQQYDLNLDGLEVQLIHVGPAHRKGDTIVHIPKEQVVFAGDLVFRQCTPLGWVGTYDSWFRALDLLEELQPEVIVPGHGAVCGLEGPRELRAYLRYVRTEAWGHFEEGDTALEAAKQIEFGPYSEWAAPGRLYLNVERAYREFRGEPPDQGWNMPKVFDAMYALARAKGLPPEF